ncbi:MAG: DUF4837 family protein [Crocinitomicaceae bacterium]|nr:DUF4837 family protein [Crocinitomicaceae bacterium]
MRILLFSVLSLVFVSCGPSLTREDLLPDASGPHGQIVLLMEEDMWMGAMGDAVMYHLDQNAKGPYLRPEPMFDVWHMRPDELDHVSQMNRMILKVMIDHDSTYKETAIIEKKNYFAKGQLFIIIKDSDPDRMYSFIVNEFAYVVNLFNKFELDLLKDEYIKRPNKAIQERAKEAFGISISLPELCGIKVDSSDFMWIKRDRSKQVMANATMEPGSDTYWIQQGILIWSKPYSDTSQLTVAGVLRDRDSTLKYHVPGKVKGSYMATEYDEYYKPEGKIVKFKDAYAVEIRGLWKHAGNPDAFGGGPFVQYAIHHESRKSVVTVCVYIYGPNYDKREYIREADAMIQTIEFVD